jgi:hypothetical protein
MVLLPFFFKKKGVYNVFKHIHATKLREREREIFTEGCIINSNSSSRV